MPRWHQLTVNELTQLGIVFKTDAEAAAFADMIEEELEVRVGRKIGEGLSDQEMQAFNNINDPALASMWLDEHCPNYGEMVSAVGDELENELLHWRKKIAGICLTVPRARNGILLEDLGLSEYSLGYLRDAGFRTLGQLRDLDAYPPILQDAVALEVTELVRGMDWSIDQEWDDFEVLDCVEDDAW